TRPPRPRGPCRPRGRRVLGAPSGTRADFRLLCCPAPEVGAFWGQLPEQNASTSAARALPAPRSARSGGAFRNARRLPPSVLSGPRGRRVLGATSGTKRADLGRAGLAGPEVGAFWGRLPERAPTSAFCAVL